MEIVKNMISSLSNPLVLILGLVNFILGIIILVFLLQDSKFTPNKYGESPKYVTVDDKAEGAKAEQSDFDKGMDKVGDAIDNFADAAQEKAEDLAEKAKDTASDLVDKAKDAAENVADKAKDVAENVADKAKDLTEKAKDAID
jgi:gas vesicle protein